jgi:hypothetical protein
MAIPAARDPGPLVTLARSRTVANADSIKFLVRRLMRPCEWKDLWAKGQSPV